MVTLEDLDSQPFQCHFHWDLSTYVGTCDPESIVQKYKHSLLSAKKRENIVEQFAYHMSLAYMFYENKNLKEHGEHVCAAHKLSKNDPGMFHVFQANFYVMLQRVGMDFEGKSVDSYANPFQTLSNCSQAIVWAIRSFTLKGLSSYAFDEALKGFEKASFLDSQNYQWQLAIGEMKEKLQAKDMGLFIPSKPQLLNFKEAIRLGGPKLPLAIALSELVYDYIKSGTKTFNKLTDLMIFVSHLLDDVLSEDPLCGEDYVRVGRMLSSLPGKQRNLDLGRECFDKAILLDGENPAVNHMFAKHLLHNKQKEKGLLYLEKAVQCSEDGFFPAAMDLLRQKNNLKGEKFDTAKEILQLLERYRAPYQQAILCGSLADFLRKSKPSTALTLYQKAVDLYKAEGKQHKCYSVFKYAWQQQPDGSSKRIYKENWRFQNLEEEITQLKEELSKS